MELKIRKLEAKDSALAVDVVKSFDTKDVSLEYMERFLLNPLNYLIVAEVDDDLAGFLLAHALQRLKQESYKMFIYEIDVAEKHRRKGVGTALINQVRRIVRDEKMMNAFVFTNYSNEGAVEFYKNTGGKIENGDDLMFVYED
jgi:aminoglycoside 3-N-acetyltransferase I